MSDVLILVHETDISLGFQARFSLVIAYSGVGDLIPINASIRHWLKMECNDLQAAIRRKRWRFYLLAHVSIYSTIKASPKLAIILPSTCLLTLWA